MTWAETLALAIVSDWMTYIYIYIYITISAKDIYLNQYSKHSDRVLCCKPSGQGTNPTHTSVYVMFSLGVSSRLICMSSVWPVPKLIKELTHIYIYIYIYIGGYR